MFHPRPAPLTPGAEVARLDGELRVHSWRWRNADISDETREEVRIKLDEALERRHTIAPGEEL